jgi:hypothetical protein
VKHIWIFKIIDHNPLAFASLKHSARNQGDSFAVIFHQGHPVPLRLTQKPERQTTLYTKKAGSTLPRKPAAGHHQDEKEP